VVPRAETKREYFGRYLGDPTLSEEMASASFGAFNAPGQDSLTLRYLRPALDTLRWIQAERRASMVARWLSGIIGGQTSPEAVAVIDRFLAEHPEFPRDLRLKILQERDDYERTARIRARYAR
jgi:aminopeptidase N